MRLQSVLLLTVAFSGPLFGQTYQTYTISTLAGGAAPGNVLGTSVSLGAQAVAIDQTGGLLIVSQNTVQRVDAATGIVSVIAGNGTFGFGGDGSPGPIGQLALPTGIAVDSAGNLYIADTRNNRIRLVSNTIITTIAGNGTQGFSGDTGLAVNAQLNAPTGVAVDSAGNLYIADSGNQRVRKVTSGVINTVAGNGTAGFSGDTGVATSAQLNAPVGVAVDSAGNLYIADSNNNCIREVTSTVITTVAGNRTPGSGGDNGQASSAQLNAPAGVAVDSSGNLYIADTGGSRVRKVSKGVITTVAGTGTPGFSGDKGAATSAQLAAPAGVALDSSGNIYIADTGNNRVRKVSGGTISTVAGNGAASYSGDNGPALSAQLSGPTGLAADHVGNIYVADTNNDRIREVSGGGISTVAGNGSAGFSGDKGSALSAQLNAPQDIAVDSAGNLYIADTLNHRVREVSGGTISTIAGTGTAGSGGDNGPASSAQLNAPAGVAVDSAGNLYIADTVNNRIRMVSNGTISTIAGNGRAGYSGDGGLATSAQLNAPTGVAVDSAGNVYIADTNNNCVRELSNQVIVTLAGNGTAGFGGDNGPPAGALLNGPAGVAVDSAGNVYIADRGNNRIREVSNGVITTLAGNGTPGFSGDHGPATTAGLSSLASVAVDSSGNLYAADTYSSRVRVLNPIPCSYEVELSSLQAPAAGGDLTVGVESAGSCFWTVSGLPDWITVSGASSGTGSAIVTLVIAPNSGDPQSATITIAGEPLTIIQLNQFQVPANINKHRARVATLDSGVPLE